MKIFYKDFSFFSSFLQTLFDIKAWVLTLWYQQTKTSYFSV